MSKRVCVFGGLGVESSVALLIHRYTFTNWSESSDSCRNLNWFFLNFTKIRSWKHIFFTQYTSTNIRDTQYLLIISDAVSDAWLTLFDYFSNFSLFSYSKFFISKISLVDCFSISVERHSIGSDSVHIVMSVGGFSRMTIASCVVVARGGF